MRLRRSISCINFLRWATSQNISSRRCIRSRRWLSFLSLCLRDWLKLWSTANTTRISLCIKGLSISWSKWAQASTHLSWLISSSWSLRSMILGLRMRRKGFSSISLKFWCSIIRVESSLPRESSSDYSRIWGSIAWTQKSWWKRLLSSSQTGLTQ